MLAFLLALHLLAAIVWIGGMFFAHLILRPSSEYLPMPLRVGLWARALRRFMVWVWGAVILLPITGYAMIFYGFGGFGGLALYIHLMQGLGWIMIGLFLYVYYFPYRGLMRMYRESLIPEAGMYIQRIRRVVSVNLTLGLIVALIGAMGRYW